MPSAIYFTFLVQSKFGNVDPDNFTVQLVIDKALKETLADYK